MKVIRIESLSLPTPHIALIADSAWRPDGKPLFLPDGSWSCELRIAIRVDRVGKFISPKFASRYYSSFAVVNYLKPAVDTAFYGLIDDALVQGPWLPLPETETIDIAIKADTTTSASIMIDHSAIDRAIVALSADVTLKTGDIIIMPEAIHAYIPQVDQRVAAKIGDISAIEFTIK